MHSRRWWTRGGSARRPSGARVCHDPPVALTSAGGAGSRVAGRPVSSIHDVARAAGVSTATVSRALRGLDRVRPETRARVLAAAQDLSYVTSPTAASLASGRTRVVGVVVPFLDRWFFANVLDGTEELLRRHGYHLLLFKVGARSSTRTLMLDHGLLRGRVDGLLVLAADLEPEEVAVLARLQVPLATVGLDVAGWDRVRIEDVRVAEVAIGHLTGLGHRRVGYVGGRPERDVHTATALDRLAGVGRALARAGMGLAPECVVQSDWTVRGGIAAGHRLLDLPDPPTAVLAASDEMAIGVLHAARTRGCDVPGQLSVMGIDDHEMSFTHDLTTVAQPAAEQGRAAGRLLVAAMSSPPGTPRPRRVTTLPTRLVVRGSTDRPAAP